MSNAAIVLDQLDPENLGVAERGGTRLAEAIQLELSRSEAGASEAVFSPAVEDFVVKTAVVESLGRIESHRDAIVRGECKLGPGQPIRMSEALGNGEGVAQGDLNLIVRERVPEGYELRENGGGQLVPGNTTGAKHIITDLTAVEIYDPPGWSPTYDELKGPFLVVKREVENLVGHPVHGPVTIPADRVVECGYQRVWDQEELKARRQRD